MHSTFLHSISADCRAEQKTSKININQIVPFFSTKCNSKLFSLHLFIHCLVPFFGCLLRSRCKSMNWSFFSLRTPGNTLLLLLFRLLLFLFYIQQIDKTMFWNCSTKKEADKSAMQTKFIKTKLKTWEKIEQPQRFIRCHRFKWQNPKQMSKLKTKKGERSDKEKSYLLLFVICGSNSKLAPKFKLTVMFCVCDYVNASPENQIDQFQWHHRKPILTHKPPPTNLPHAQSQSLSINKNLSIISINSSYVEMIQMKWTWF